MGRKKERRECGYSYFRFTDASGVGVIREGQAGGGSGAGEIMGKGSESRRVVRHGVPPRGRPSEERTEREGWQNKADVDRIACSRCERRPQAVSSAHSAPVLVARSDWVGAGSRHTLWQVGHLDLAGIHFEHHIRFGPPAGGQQDAHCRRLPDAALAAIPDPLSRGRLGCPRLGHAAHGVERRLLVAAGACRDGAERDKVLGGRDGGPDGERLRTGHVPRAQVPLRWRKHQVERGLQPGARVGTEGGGGAGVAQLDHHGGAARGRRVRGRVCRGAGVMAERHDGAPGRQATPLGGLPDGEGRYTGQAEAGHPHESRSRPDGDCKVLQLLNAQRPGRGLENAAVQLGDALERDDKVLHGRDGSLEGACGRRFGQRAASHKVVARQQAICVRVEPAHGLVHLRNSRPHVEPAQRRVELGAGHQARAGDVERVEGLQRRQAARTQPAAHRGEQRAVLEERELVLLAQHGRGGRALPWRLPPPPAPAHFIEKGLPLVRLVGLQAAEQQVLAARVELGLRREKGEALVHDVALVVGGGLARVVDRVEHLGVRVQRDQRRVAPLVAGGQHAVSRLLRDVQRASERLGFRQGQHDPVARARALLVRVQLFLNERHDGRLRIVQPERPDPPAALVERIRRGGRHVRHRVQIDRAAERGELAGGEHAVRGRVEEAEGRTHALRLLRGERRRRAEGERLGQLPWPGPRRLPLHGADDVLEPPVRLEGPAGPEVVGRHP
eukprot:scaffold3143_cov104-Isochrysis_galbana.AAC.4